MIHRMTAPGGPTVAPVTAILNAPPSPVVAVAEAFQWRPWVGWPSLCRGKASIRAVRCSARSFA